MRAFLAAGVLLLASVGLSGCFDRQGTLTIELAVDAGSHVSDFRSLNLTLKDVRIKAKTLNPETVPSSVARLEMAQAAQSGQKYDIFSQQVRSDNYQRIEITTQGSTFQGYLQDGTPVGVVVPNGVFVVTTDFDVPRGGSATYTLVVGVQKVDTGTGQPSYTVVPDTTASGATTSG